MKRVENLSSNMIPLILNCDFGRTWLKSITVLSDYLKTSSCGGKPRKHNIHHFSAAIRWFYFIMTFRSCDFFDDLRHELWMPNFGIAFGATLSALLLFKIWFSKDLEGLGQGKNPRSLSVAKKQSSGIDCIWLWWSSS